jgi:hypothetical protein
MVSYFNQLFREEGLVNVEPVKFLPTWRNGRGEQDFVAKRLDCFLINENLAFFGYRYKYSMVNVKIYHHMPVVFQLDQEQENISYPFKLNYASLTKLDFVKLVRTNWNMILGTWITSPMDSLVQNLKLIKSLVLGWERNKNSFLRRN